MTFLSIFYHLKFIRLYWFGKKVNWHIWGLKLGFSGITTPQDEIPLWYHSKHFFGLNRVVWVTVNSKRLTRQSVHELLREKGKVNSELFPVHIPSISGVYFFNQLQRMSDPLDILHTYSQANKLSYQSVKRFFLFGRWLKIWSFHRETDRPSNCPRRFCVNLWWGPLPLTDTNAQKCIVIGLYRPKHGSYVKASAHDYVGCTAR